MEQAEINKETISTDTVMDATTFYNELTKRGVCVPTNNQSHIDLFYKICSILVFEKKSYDEMFNHSLTKNNNLIKNHTPNFSFSVFQDEIWNRNDYRASISMFSRIFENEEFMDYLSTLTVLDLHILRVCLHPRSYNDKNVVFFAKMALNDNLKQNLQKIEDLLKGFTIESEFKSRNKEVLRKEQDIASGLDCIPLIITGKFYTDYIIKTQSKYDNGKVKTLVQDWQHSWLKEKRYMNYVIFKLLQKFSVVETMQYIDYVIASDYSFTVDEWMDLIDNYKEYKDMPVSWIIEFVYDENSETTE